jgi:hypothetical protein
MLSQTLVLFGIALVLTVCFACYLVSYSHVTHESFTAENCDGISVQGRSLLPWNPLFAKADKRKGCYYEMLPDEKECVSGGALTTQHNITQEPGYLIQNCVYADSMMNQGVPDEGVTMYEHCSFGGRSVKKPAGRYNMSEMWLPNDFISAIKVSPGYQVTIYEHMDFQGSSQIFTTDASCLLTTPGGNWNDRISSFVVAKVEASAAAAVEDGGVTMYEHCSFGGRSVKKPAGRYNMSEMGLPNDFISAIKVSPGYQVTIYEHKDFQGSSQIFTTDASCLLTTPGGNWNDRISSFVIEKVEASAAA